MFSVHFFNPKPRQKDPGVTNAHFEAEFPGRILSTVLAGPPRKHQDRVTASLVCGHGSGDAPRALQFMARGQRGALLLVPFMRLRCSP
ncbi:hypothetical protein MTO96_050265 [Rhipicephalus appendiculatus]